MGSIRFVQNARLTVCFKEWRVRITGVASFGLSHRPYTQRDKCRPILILPFFLNNQLFCISCALHYSSSFHKSVFYSTIPQNGYYLNLFLKRKHFYCQPNIYTFYFVSARHFSITACLNILLNRFNWSPTFPVYLVIWFWSISDFLYKRIFKTIFVLLHIKHLLFNF